MTSESVSRYYCRAEGFRAADAPLLVVGTDLVIREVNAAYLQVTARTDDELLGTQIFEAFPDNPHDPDADGVARLGASFERVFRDGRRDHMPLQRYDILSGDAPAGFARRFWIMVNTPLRDESGRVFGALHHVEDVTIAADAITTAGTPSPPDPGMDQHTLAALVSALAREVLGHRHDRTRADQLQHALDSRIVIEQAKGMIAAREGITVDQAFDRLRKHARRHGAHIHQVARAVVELGLSV